MGCRVAKPGLPSCSEHWQGPDSLFFLEMQVIYHVTILGKSLKFPDSTPEGFRALGEACLSADPSKRPSFLEILDTLDRM